MKNLFVCLIFLISFANAIQCYNGKTYVDIPESKLSEVGYTEYNITHSKFDCKIAYKRYLKIKETEQVNVSQVKSEKLKEGPSKIGFFLPICLLVLIVFIIWLIKIVVQKEPQDELNLSVQKELIKPKNNSIKTEYIKSWDDLSREYSLNLIKIEEERQKKEQAYFDAISGKNYSIKPVEPIKPKNNDKTVKTVKTGDDSFDDYWNNIFGYISDDDSENLRNPVKSVQKFNKTYEELLTEQEWYNFKKKVIYDRGYVCEFCNKKHNLQVHHKLYYKKPDKEKIEPWLYNMEEVLLLCNNCHKSVHKKNKIKVYYISYADYNHRKVGFYNDFKQS